MGQDQLLAALDSTTHDRWVELSRRTRSAASGRSPCAVNEDLQEEAGREPEAPTAPAYRLWVAENLAREARYAEALPAFDAAIERGENASPLVEGVDVVGIALHHKAQAASHAGQLDAGTRAFRDLAERADDPEPALHEAGHVLEMSGRLEEAGELYLAAAGSTQEGAGRARRALDRLEDGAGSFFPGPARLADRVRAAVLDRDLQAVRALLSKTHFSTGVAGGHVDFDSDSVVRRFCAELADNRVEVERTLRGSGDKRYLVSKGWQGDWFRGRVLFSLARTGRGWQWTGLLISAVTDPWREHWSAGEPRTNQPLTLEIRAPWPAGERFTAGGLDDFAARSAAVAAAGLGAPLVALAFSLDDCGYGTRGFYYNSPISSTHQDEDAFAIDFTRYRRGVPFDNESGGTPVLAVADGIVVSACSGTPSGSGSASNTVEIRHDDPDTGQPRYLSRYLHLAGPFQLSVSALMAVGTGARLGLMNDTGNSALDHLHFSIHDQNSPFPGAGATCGGVTRGTSVRPSPMDGQDLDDGDSGKCVRSSNHESVPVGAVVGNITLLRAHELGSGFGPPDEFLDVEVVVQLDSSPDTYGLQLRRGEELPARRRMLGLLRRALLADRPVRIEFVRATAADLRIIRVEPEEAPQRPFPRPGDLSWRVLDALER